MTSLNCPTCGGPRFHIEGIHFDEMTATLSRVGFDAKVHVTKTQYKLFQLLIARPGHVFANHIIMDTCYGHKPECDWPDTLASVKVSISRLRKGLRKIGLTIDNRYGEGWLIREGQFKMHVRKFWHRRKRNLNGHATA